MHGCLVCNKLTAQLENAVLAVFPMRDTLYSGRFNQQHFYGARTFKRLAPMPTHFLLHTFRALTWSLLLSNSFFLSLPSIVLPRTSESRFSVSARVPALVARVYRTFPAPAVFVYTYTEL
ncbi:hypothetical protein NDU88_002011 [Pleurodeles waltl]|uniref:Uncharacterized protein n=1 Tax=Pleurodeles waltl TaxID=8319 RepID=A0AAV7M243_PLEWA|nr:hypothetical protein NDU88_002011 [Pleurodeles waltl]